MTENMPNPRYSPNGSQLNSIPFLAILAMLNFGEDAIIGGTSWSSYRSRSQIESLCLGWLTLYWFALIMFVLAVTFLIVAVVKKQSSAPKIVGICFAVLALIFFIVCTTQYSKISDRYSLATSRYGSYYDYIY